MDDLPESVSEEMLEDESFLKRFHHALLEVHLEQGALVCPETGGLHGGPPSQAVALTAGGQTWACSLQTPHPPPVKPRLATCCHDAAGRKFVVSDGIPNLLLREDEC